MTPAEKLVGKLFDLLAARANASLPPPSQLVIHSVMWKAIASRTGIVRGYPLPSDDVRRDTFYGIPVEIDDTLGLYAMLVIDHLKVESSPTIR